VVVREVRLDLGYIDHASQEANLIITASSLPSASSLLTRNR